VTSPEREAVRVLLDVLKVGEWQGNGKCPKCSFVQLRGHKCSCPVKLAYKLLQRSLGTFEVGIEDEDLIVAQALKDLESASDRETRRRVVWAAVDAAMLLGARK
jgi:hypothetical protein